MAGQVEIWEPKEQNIEIVPAQPIMLKNNHVNLRNCFNMEEELAESIEQIRKSYEKSAPEIEEYETYPKIKNQKSKIKNLIFAHGIVAASVKSALANLQLTTNNFQLFRPITLRPFPTNAARKIAQDAQKILVIESSDGQFARMVKSELYGIQTPIETYLKPAMGITPEEILSIISNF
jgi:2-oxoglutarate ferredoxin oxidoreductase subunit alpha